MSRPFLLGATLLNCFASAAFVFIAVTERFQLALFGVELFLPITLLNAVLLLRYLYLIRTTPDLSESERNGWSIAVFAALGFGQLAYLLWHRARVRQ